MTFFVLCTTAIGALCGDAVLGLCVGVGILACGLLLAEA